MGGAADTDTRAAGRAWRRAVAVAIGAAVVLLAYAAGLSEGRRWGLRLLEREAGVNLAQRVEVLSRLRTDDLQGGLAELEGQVDHLVLVVAAQPGHSTESLRVAKAYREAVPSPRGDQAELDAVFSQLPPTSSEQCSDALKRLRASVLARDTFQ